MSSADLAMTPLVDSFVAMASTVTVRVESPIGEETDAALGLVRACFFDIAERCTRFDATSELMVLNASPRSDIVVSEVLFSALLAARDAYLATEGRFDPRVLADLISLGYDSSFQPGLTGKSVTTIVTERPVRTPWLVRLDPVKRLVNLGGTPIDLGGIAKSFALKRAADVLARFAKNFLIDAGGDLIVAGHPIGLDHWQIGVEDPTGAPTPLAVLAVRDGAIATSSIRLRSWSVGTAKVHHLIDPTTGLSGGDGLSQVTVIAPSPMQAETWSKALFLEGSTAIVRKAVDEGIRALWVTRDGQLFSSPAATDDLVWSR